MKHEKESSRPFIVYTIISLIISIVAISIITVPTLSIQIVEKIKEFLSPQNLSNIIIILQCICLSIYLIRFFLGADEAFLNSAHCRKVVSDLNSRVEIICKNTQLDNINFAHNVFDTNYLISYYQSRIHAEESTFPGQIQHLHAYILASTQNCSKELFYSVKSICDDMKLDTIQSCEDILVDHKLHNTQSPICSAQLIVVIFDRSDADLCYKLGIAHAYDKPTILLINSNDLSQGLITGRNVVYYSDLCDLKDKLTQDLKELLGLV